MRGCPMWKAQALGANEDRSLCERTAGRGEALGKHLTFAGRGRLQVRLRERGAAARASFLTRRSRSAIASAHAARRDDRAALALERGESGAAAEIAVR